MYKQLISLFNRDTAFRIMKNLIRIQSRIPFARAQIRLNNRKATPKFEREILGCKFINPIGLGPGLDKNGQLYNILYDYGYSFIDLGPVNLSNVKTVINNLQKNPADPIIGICINKDHSQTFSLAYDFADYFVMEGPDNDIEDILDEILNIRLAYDTYKPVLLRITHDLPQDQFAGLLKYSMLNGIDGFVFAKAENVRRASALTLGRFPIIGYGGVRTPEMLREMLDAGADLIEITTGLVLDGPSLVKKLVKSLETK